MGCLGENEPLTRLRFQVRDGGFVVLWFCGCLVGGGGGRG